MKKLLLVLLLVPLFPRAQIINAVAGNGTAGYSGNGSAAISAEINTPFGIATDHLGQIYIADRFNHCLRKIDSSGNISTIAGNGSPAFSGDGGPSTAAQLHYPAGVTVDLTGNIYFTDGFNHRIRKIDTNGIISTIAGNGIGGYTGDGVPATATALYDPYGLATDTGGNLYFCDTYNNRVRKIDTDGIITTIAGNGISGYAGDGGPATAAEINYQVGIAIDRSGNIYLAENQNNCIRKIDTNGIIRTIAGTGFGSYSGDGGAATAATFYNPVSVVIDTQNNVLIADNGNNRIRKIDSNGTVSTIAGTGTAGHYGDGGLATYAGLGNPFGLAVSNSGIIYVAQPIHNCIRKIAPGAPLFSAQTEAPSTMVICPVLAHDQVTISAKFTIKLVTMYNVGGQIVHSEEFNSNHVAVDITLLSPGLYFVKVNDEIVRKIVKE